MGRKSMLGQRQLSRKLSEVGLCYGIELGDASPAFFCAIRENRCQLL